MPPLVNTDLVERIRAADDPEQSGLWPSSRLQCLRDAGVFRWGLPTETGGRDETAADLLCGYIDLARICLTTAFVMTQRDAACHRIAASKNRELRHSLLPDLSTGRLFATVGISHLSTSRQHWSKPSVVAIRTPHGFELSGEAPWVTGATHANLLVTGGTLENGDQIIAVVPRDRAGVQIAPPLELLALNASCTGTVILDHVAISADEIVAGPIPQVMKVGATGGTGSLTTSAVALGAAGHTIDGLQSEAERRPDLQSLVDSLARERDDLRADLVVAVTDPKSEDERRIQAEQFRFRSNSIAMRAAQAYVCCAKGAGFVSGHPAERALRESLFFQVWSCPPAVTSQTLSKLAVAEVQ
ncbi:MAG: sulfur acquisition oxidoreductase, SfnB family [Schlesneria sp.]|nr:sulfur acquisition oxidoreductase, SfnB family [Schlesneria sp.]